MSLSPARLRKVEAQVERAQMTRRTGKPVLYASFGQRTAAFLIDIVPITVLVAVVFYVFLGFDETLNRYLENGRQNLAVP